MDWTSIAGSTFLGTFRQVSDANDPDVGAAKRPPPAQTSRTKATRWIGASALIVAAHLGVMTWLATRPVPTVPVPFVMDVTLGFGPEGSGPFGEPVPEPAPLEPQPEPASESAPAEAETTPPESLEEPVSDSESPSAPAEPKEAAEPVEPMDAADAPSETVAPMDVLAAVEALTGMTAEQAAAPSQITAAIETAGWTASQAGGGGDRCGIAAQVQRAFLEQADLRTALSAIPRDELSVANALLIWNGTWVVTDPIGDRDPILPLRTAVSDVVRAAPGDCRRAEMRGPMFMLTQNADDTQVIVVVGSGLWRWDDLVADPIQSSDRRRLPSWWPRF